MTITFFTLNRAADLDEVTKQQHFLRHRGLTRIRVGDDGESAAQRQFFCHVGHSGVRRTRFSSSEGPLKGRDYSRTWSHEQWLIPHRKY